MLIGFSRVRRLSKWKKNYKPKKKRKNNETTDPLQNNKSSLKYIPQSWRDLRVSNAAHAQNLNVSAKAPRIARNP